MRHKPQESPTVLRAARVGVGTGLCIAFASALLAAPANAQRLFGGAAFDTSAVTRLIVLGSGTPVPDPERAGPAYAVTHGRRVFLFDAGAGVMRRVAAAKLPIDGFTAVFLTHLHSDHTLGLPDVIHTTWVMGRSTPLRVLGPRGTAAMVDHIQAAWAEDIEIRTEGTERGRRGGHRVSVREIGAGVVYDSAGIRITAIPVTHGSWPVALGFRIDAPDRSIVLGGDAAPSPALEAAARDVDVLVHEVYASTRVAPEKRPGGELWPQYLREFHTSDEELGAIAARAQPKTLVLSHVLRMGGTMDEVVAGIRRGGFRGTVVVAKDLDRY
ncbi:MAG: MBL fold metallo-hydrolase [Gemmatimonadetes bacterium]|nr:MBL fold metallo-hydrolase [Gemmatimonadota bacterium]